MGNVVISLPQFDGIACLWGRCHRRNDTHNALRHISFSFAKVTILKTGWGPMHFFPARAQEAPPSAAVCRIGVSATLFQSEFNLPLFFDSRVAR
jgi:hypothetical protein